MTATMDEKEYKASIYANREVTERNINALKDMGEATRIMLRDMELEHQKTERMLLALKQQLDQMQGQLALLQAKVLGGAATT